MKTKELTLEFVNENFYEIDGILYRKDYRNCSNCNDKDGYCVICFNYKQYKVHRILWIIYHQQEIPEGYVIDHLDGDKSNNSKENLRLATSSENNHNRKNSKNNLTGYKGISIWTNKTNSILYISQIDKNNKRYKKYFPYTPEGLESAKLWLEEKRKELHGEFARNE